MALVGVDPADRVQDQGLDALLACHRGERGGVLPEAGSAPADAGVEKLRTDPRQIGPLVLIDTRELVMRVACQATACLEQLLATHVIRATQMLVGQHFL